MEIPDALVRAAAGTDAVVARCDGLASQVQVLTEQQDRLDRALAALDARVLALEPEPAPDPVPAPNPVQVLVSARWQGTDITAGGALPGLYCSATRAEVLDVVPAVALGMPGTSALRIRERGTRCGNVERADAIPAPNLSHYGRVYFRAEGSFNANKLMTYNTTGAIQLIPLGIEGTRLKLHFLRDQNGAALPSPVTWGFYRPFAEGAVYRYEWHVEYDPTPAGSLPGSVRLWPRLYDGGALIAEADGFSAGGVSLATYYAQGGRIGVTDLALARRFSVGMDGNNGYQDPGGVGYLSELLLQVGGWVGA